MNRSQPIDMNSERAKKLGLTEEALEKSRRSKTAVKVETVDDMFDFSDYKPGFFIKLSRPFRRIKRRLDDRKHAKWCYKRWRGLLAEYRPYSIRAFLPLFIKHLEDYIALEKKQGIAAPECREYKIKTAQEAVDIMKRLMTEDYDRLRSEPVEQKWGKSPYKKTTYEDGSVGFEHLTPEDYDREIHEAYEKAAADEMADLKRLGEIIEQNMMDWWD